MKWFLLLFLLFSLNHGQTAEKNKCVQIYYDGVANFGFGRAIVLPLQNLLGHFPSFTRYIIPLDKYKKGDLEKCEASIYLGSYFDATIPEDFLQDYTTTSKRVAWLGYNIWKLGDARLNSLWGVNYSKIEGLNWAKKDEKGRPGYFKFFEYKDEIFEKYGELKPDDPKEFIASWELVHLEQVRQVGKVVSWARHSTTAQKIPYIIENNNHWYVADLPFTFMTEEDRYLIFSDLLFDILDEKPLYPEHAPAFVRFEDLHPLISTFQLGKILEVTRKLQIPYGLSLIPIFQDPLGAFPPNGVAKQVALSQKNDFVASIQEHVANNASLLYHGVTHQYENLKNPFNGVSGADCEFWDCIQERPVEKESLSYFLDKLEYGMSEFDSVGFRPSSWLTPHYMGSPLANALFAEVFSWNIGRMNYLLGKTNLNGKLPEQYTFETSGVGGRQERITFLSNLKWEQNMGVPAVLQFYPYETFSDINGARFVPENVGFLQPKDVGQGGKIWNVNDMLRVLKRNRVLRDVWGSYFIHPFMFNTIQDGGLAKFPGDTSEVERLLKETKALGYDFIDFKTWKNQRAKIRTKLDIEQ